ncbi:hypothetical protein NE236_25305 [Actinoallomurus purpureus]|uniref:hypothetical protein n=1 Tax=Actinoallomurus purpureus TaxID=478114 RepID=UPI002092488D|nr:hypothetical protein [Actinoallomurus purpureus]MCO6008300.1 hypothetical protein [Actinoallomurus purpureus]
MWSLGRLGRALHRRRLRRVLVAAVRVLVAELGVEVVRDDEHRLVPEPELARERLAAGVPGRELVANALRHTRSGRGGSFTVDVYHDPCVLHLVGEPAEHRAAPSVGGGAVLEIAACRAPVIDQARDGLQQC